MARELLPNSTQIPDVILDFWLSELSGAELKVVLYVARRTYGFGKTSDNISLTQICSGITKRDGTVLDTGTGLSRSSVARAVKTLEEQGIILRRLNLSETSNEHEESTYSLNLDWQRNRGSGGGGKVVPKSNPQETDQETVQETAAGENAAGLLEELLRRNVNRVDAIRLVKANPKECQRQLQFLAYMPPRKDEARWLVSAIEGGYGPPKSYHEEKANEARARETKERETAQALREKARQSHQAAQERNYLAYLTSRLSDVENHQPQAFMAFTEAEATKRAFYTKTLPGHLSQFDSKREYLLRFAEFFAAKKEGDVLSF